MTKQILVLLSSSHLMLRNNRRWYALKGEETQIDATIMPDVSLPVNIFD
jgi:hypothetical protein